MADMPMVFDDSLSCEFCDTDGDRIRFVCDGERVQEFVNGTLGINDVEDVWYLSLPATTRIALTRSRGMYLCEQVFSGNRDT